MKKLTFGQILNMISAYDDDMLEMTDEEYEEMIGKELPQKVDSIYEFLSKQKAEVERLKNESRILSEAAKRLHNNTERFKKYLLFHMNNQGIGGINGKTYRISARNSERVETVVEPTNSLFLKHHMDFPDLISREFKFNKNVLRDIIKRGVDNDIKSYAKITMNTSLKTSVKK